MLPTSEVSWAVGVSTVATTVFDLGAERHWELHLSQTFPHLAHFLSVRVTVGLRVLGVDILCYECGVDLTEDGEL